MRVLVADVSVLFCLEQGHLLEAVLSSKIQLTVPDLLYEYELKDFNGSHLIKMGLCVEELDAKAVTLAVNYKRRFSALCLVESFALALGKISNFAMLTDNQVLRRLAISERVNCHDSLWLLDRIVNEKVMSFDNLYLRLIALLNSPNCCLPHRELNEWIQQFMTQK